MKVWEAINILESLDPKSEVTLVLSKATKAEKPQEPKYVTDYIFVGNPYDKTYVIGKEGWPDTPAYPEWHNQITCGIAH
jgi:hypothetical protein